jgi:hypothetical protein
MMSSAPTSNPPTDSLVARTLGGIFDEAFDLYKRHFLTIALLVAIVFIPLQIGLHAASDIWLKPLQKHLQGQTNFDNNIGEAFTFGTATLFVGDPQQGIPGLLQILVLILISGPVTLAVSEIYAGRQITTRQAYRRAAPMMGRLLGAWLLVALILLSAGFFSVSIVSIVFALTFANLAGVLPEITVVGIVVAMIVIPYLICCAIMAYSFLFTTPLMVIEGLPFSFATTRNARLAGRGRFLRVWGATVFLPLVVVGLRSLILFSVAMALAAVRLPPFVAFLTHTALASLIYFFFEPYWMIVITLLYYDCRYRREGYDVNLMTDSALPLPAHVPVAPPGSPPITPAAPPLASSLQERTGVR